MSHPYARSHITQTSIINLVLLQQKSFISMIKSTNKCMFKVQRIIRRQVYGCSKVNIRVVGTSEGGDIRTKRGKSNGKKECLKNSTCFVEGLFKNQFIYLFCEMSYTINMWVVFCGGICPIEKIY